MQVVQLNDEVPPVVAKNFPAAHAEQLEDPVLTS